VSIPTWFDDDVDAPEEAPGAEHVVVRLGAGRYAVDAARVVEVVAVPGLTRVPGTPSWLSGVANWRGHVLPVADLRPLLGIPATPLASSARVVVVRDETVEVGLVADAVLGMLEVPLDHPAAPATLEGDAAELVCGLADEDSPAGPAALLDVDVILTLARRGR
jgi:purine-binding chemotaxis protein CheW